MRSKHWEDKACNTHELQMILEVWTTQRKQTKDQLERSWRLKMPSSSTRGSVSFIHLHWDGISKYPLIRNTQVFSGCKKDKYYREFKFASRFRQSKDVHLRVPSTTQDLILQLLQSFSWLPEFKDWNLNKYVSQSRLRNLVNELIVGRQLLVSNIQGKTNTLHLNCIKQTQQR